MSRSHIRRAVVLTVIAILMLAATALAKGPGGGGGGGGGGGETTLTNNLSVPTIMIGSSSFTGVLAPAGAPSTLVSPTGTPQTNFPIDLGAFYYVQGVHKWQGQAYSTTAPVPVTAEWGDNLTGDASLKVGSPIRVELGLFRTLDSSDAVISMVGYTVDKLEPLKLDRESKYGTLATSGELDALTVPTTFTTVRVFDTLVTLSIKDASGAYVVGPVDASAEINARGAVVYGYNLRVTATGDYTITYATTSPLLITESDAGTVAYDKKSVSLTITVGGGGGGGGGGGRPR